VNPDLDLSDIMQKLAHNWDPWSLLARHRVVDTGPIHVELISGPRPDESLVERSRALARAPYDEMPWPDPPDIGLERLAADYQRTTGHHLEFTWEYEAYPHAGFWSVIVSIDGSVSGGVGDELTGDPEVDLVRPTDRLQSEHLGEDFEGDWPKCPHHRNIVMLPKTEGGTATWTCQANSVHQVRLGNLGVDEI
jgi:hypothetical protein